MRILLESQISHLNTKTQKVKPVNALPFDFDGDSIYEEREKEK